ncbi:unnamed protein product [Soboliphyme baturini]|uniref:Aldo_ket_red domain-containing protein n=1 Tax=Soboliphyme baturini TaxID=241478 RepID=A0A183I991_9BILA|nr:unnamed protein product [Soboliphyme baturini]
MSPDTCLSMKMLSGYSIPTIGLGTYKVDPRDVERVLSTALDIGYRHIDCAELYENQTEIGATLAKQFSSGKLRRDEVFITSKVWNNAHSYSKASEAIDVILRELQLPYLDLCLIHWPQGYAEHNGFFPMV